MGALQELNLDKNKFISAIVSISCIIAASILVIVAIIVKLP